MASTKSLGFLVVFSFWLLLYFQGNIELFPGWHFVITETGGKKIAIVAKWEEQGSLHKSARFLKALSTSPCHPPWGSRQQQGPKGPGDEGLGTSTFLKTQAVIEYCLCLNDLKNLASFFPFFSLNLGKLLSSELCYFNFWAKKMKTKRQRRERNAKFKYDVLPSLRHAKIWLLGLG